MKTLPIVFVLLLAACGGATHLRRSVTYPAPLPLRAYSEIIVTYGNDVDSPIVASTFAQSVASATDRPVRLASPEEAPLYLSRTPGAALVAIQLNVTQRSVMRYDRTLEPICGASGCYTRQRMTPMPVPLLVALGVVSIRSASRQPDRRFTEIREEALDAMVPYELLIGRVRSRFLTWLAGTVSERVVEEDVTLLRVEPLPAMQEAIAQADRGDWDGARAVAETLAPSEAVAALPPQERARFLYDLSTLRRFTPAEGMTIEEFDALTRVPLEQAIALDPAETRYTDALTALSVHRDVLAERASQDRARAENEARDAWVQRIPPVPPGYESAPQ